MPPSDPNVTADGWAGSTGDPNATTAAPAAAPTTLPTVPGYEITGVLGRGAMGVVYAARHLALNRPVALKMVLAGIHADPEQLVRFLYEAELLARVSHPNVVGIYEVGKHDGLPYFALEYCPGDTLHAKLAGTPLPPRDAAKLAATLARAVQAAHDAGVVHRDLKPGNVLLAADGTPKLADFGLGRLADLTRHLTATGQVMGTPAYMAPEQAAGHPVGTLADVYALGAMLYCLLTGRPPHQGASMQETLAQVLNNDPATPRSLVPGVPRDLETIALKALHRQPERRYVTAAAFADDLDRWLAGDTILARPAGRAERAAKWTRRRPALATLAVGGTVGLVAFVLFLAAFNVRLNEKQGELDTALQQQGQDKTALAVRQSSLDAALEQQGRDKAALATRQADLDRALIAARRKGSELCLQTAQTYWDRGTSALARATLDEVATDDRRWEWRYLKRVYDPGVPFPTTETSMYDGELSSAERRLLANSIYNYARTNNAREKSEAFIGNRLNVEAAITSAFAVRSPDRTRVATTSRDKLWVWEMATGREVTVLSGHTNVVLTTTWSPDGTRVVSASKDRTARVWDATTGRELVVILGHTGAVNAAVWSPDGTRVVTASDDRTVRVWDIATGKELAVLRGHTAAVTNAVWSPDGTRVATVAGDETVRVWATDGRGEAAVFQGHVGKASVVGWFPDGRQLRTVAEGRARVWDLAQGVPTIAQSWFGWENRSKSSFKGYWQVVKNELADGAVTIRDTSTERQVAVLRGHTKWVDATAWSPDGTQLATASHDQTARVWDAATGREVAALRGHAGVVNATAWSPDGTRLASASDDGTARVWDAVTGREVAVLRGHMGGVKSAEWSPDGTYVVTTGYDKTTRVWDGSPLDGSARSQLDRLWHTLPRPEWHRDEVRTAFAGGHPSTALFHFNRASPSSAKQWVQRGQYALTAAATALAGDTRDLPKLLVASLRPPGYGANTARVRAALLETANGSAAAAESWRRLARIEGRRLVRSTTPGDSDALALAHLQRLAGDTLAAATTIYDVTRHPRLPLQDPSLAADYAIHGIDSLTAPIDQLAAKTDVGKLRLGQFDAIIAAMQPTPVTPRAARGRPRQFDTNVAAPKSESTTVRGRLCASIAHAQLGDATAARAALTAADRQLLDDDKQFLGNMLLRREAITALAALEAKSK